MSRFYLPPSGLHGNTFILAGSEAHHALHVLRKKIGDTIDLFDGKDASYRGRIDHVTSQEIHGSIIENLDASSLPIELTLYQGLTRGSKWEWLLEKACEVGVSRLVPVASQRTLIKLDPDQAAEKVKRWNRIALAACKQSGRSNLMQVTPPMPFAVAVAQLPRSSLSLIPWEKENERSIRAGVEGYQGSAVNVFIGPEGGWDASEIEMAQKFNVIPVRLGPTLLRTETAGLITAALVLREFGVY